MKTTTFVATVHDYDGRIIDDAEVVLAELHLSDSRRRSMRELRALADASQTTRVPFDSEHGEYRSGNLRPGVYLVRVSRGGREGQHRVAGLRHGERREEFVLGKRGMPAIFHGKRKVPIVPPEDRISIVLRHELTPAEQDDLDRVISRFHAEVEPQPADFFLSNIRTFRVPAGRRHQRVRRFLNELLARPYVERELPLLEHEESPVGLTGNIIVEFEAGTSLEEVDRIVREHDLEMIDKMMGLPNTFIIGSNREGYGDLEVGEALMETGRVKRVEPILLFREKLTAPVTPTNELFPLQWNLDLMRLPHAWGYLDSVGRPRFGSPDIVVSVVDTGNKTKRFTGISGPVPVHPQFMGNVSNGQPKMVDWYDFRSTRMIQDNDATTEEHGTNTSGLVAASEGPWGIAGAAPNVRLIGVISGTNTYGIGGQFMWAAGYNPPWYPTLFPNQVASGAMPVNVARPADIISCSLESPRLASQPLISPFVKLGLEVAASIGRGGRGTVLVFSAGNDGNTLQSKNRYADSDRLMFVGATSKNVAGAEVFAPYSNYGPKIDFCAPAHLNSVSAGWVVPSTSIPDHRPWTAGTGYAIAVPTTSLYRENVLPAVPTFTFAADVEPNMSGGTGNLRTTLTAMAASGAATIFVASAEGLSADLYALMRDSSGTTEVVRVKQIHTGNRVELHAALTSGFASGASFIGMVYPTDVTVGITSGAGTITVASTEGYFPGQQILVGKPGHSNAEEGTVQSVTGAGVTPAVITLTGTLGNNHPLQVKDTSTGTVNTNDVAVSVSTPAQFPTGQNIYIGEPGQSGTIERTVTGMTATTVQFAGQPYLGTTAIASGTPVYLKGKEINPLIHVIKTALSATGGAPLATTMMAASTAGATSITVADPAGFVVGLSVIITSAGGSNVEGRKISAVDHRNGIISFPSVRPLIYAHAVGTNVIAGAPACTSSFSGTSASAPQVAGVAALILTANPSLTWVEVREILRETADKINPGETDTIGQWLDSSGNPSNSSGLAPVFSQRYGYGRINAEAAVMAAWTYNSSQRDLIIRNSLTDLGTTTTRTAVDSTGNPDIWMRFVDPATDPTAFPTSAGTKGPHQRPSIDADSWVCVRVHNVGTLANLDAWVRVYVAFSSGTPPAGQTTPFAFPNDWQTERSVTERSLITLPLTGTLFIGEVKIPKGAVAGGAFHSVAVKWPKFVPPVNSNLRPFILAQITPHDGPDAMNGSEVTTNNNLSYREIDFAEVKFLNAAGGALGASINTSAAGGDLPTTFGVRVQDIRFFKRERIKIEIRRIYRTSPGTPDDVATYAYNGTAWAFSGTTPTWVTITAPSPATGDTVNVTITGTFQANKDHQEIRFRVILYEDAALTTPRIDEPFSIGVTFSAIIPRQQDYNLHVSPRFFGFLDADKVDEQAPELAYGPALGAEETHFRLTSGFTRSATATEPVNAYAAVKGTVLVQRNTTDGTVNLILKPYDQSGVEFTAVKYFVYRGLNDADFFDGENVRARSGASAFIESLYANNHQRQLDADPNATVDDTITPKAFGWDPTNQAGTMKIDQVFHRSDSDYQLPMAAFGDCLGTFRSTGEFGFEVILADKGEQYDLAFARKAYHEIDVSAITDPRALKLEREKILSFVDPAAYYGMHYPAGIFAGPSKAYVQPTAFYTDFLSKFATKNNVYLDVRNENGYSLNFYENYQGPSAATDHGTQIGIGEAPGSVVPLTAETYHTHGWPIIIRQPVQGTAEESNLLYTRYRLDDNLNPILYLASGVPVTTAVNGKFVHGEDLLGATPGAWTEDVGIAFPNHDTGQDGLRTSVATVLKLHYARKVPASTPTFGAQVLPDTSYTDNAFGPIDAASVWNDTQWAGTEGSIAWASRGDAKYVDAVGTSNPANAYKEFGYVAERGIARRPETVVLYAVASSYAKYPTDQAEKVVSVQGGVQPNGPFFKVVPGVNRLRADYQNITEAGSGEKRTLISLAKREGSELPPEGLLALCLTTDEFQTLKDLTGFDAGHDRYVTLEEISSGTSNPYFLDQDGQRYNKYRLKVHGQAADGTFAQAGPGSDIEVYTKDGLTFASPDFVDATPPEPDYDPNYEEVSGLKPRSGEGDEEESTWFDYFLVPHASRPTAPATTEIQSKVTAFQDALDAVTVTTTDPITQLTNAVTTHAPLLLAYGRSHVQATYDDRLLYWGRLWMLYRLKSHPYLIGNDKAGDLVKQFEELSRGYSIGSFDSGVKKVLITGFDPFKLRQGESRNNPQQSNPSGVAALYLYDKRGTTAGGRSYHIKSTIFPVRFEDFDQGVVENAVGPYLDGTASGGKADLVISISQGRPGRYDIERWASRARGPVSDNNGKSNVPAKFYCSVTKEFLETKLPIPTMVPGTLGNNTVIFNQSWESRNPSGEVDHSSPGSGATPSSNVPSSTATSVSGSGGDYLSNESFYRIATCRDAHPDNQNHVIPTGHLHVPQLQLEGQPFDATATATLVSDVLKIIENAIDGL